MKFLYPVAALVILAACAQNQGAPDTTAAAPQQRYVGNDALPSAEVTAFETTNARLKWTNARIEHDANNCAVYEGIAADGQVRREPLRDASNQPLCLRK